MDTEYGDYVTPSEFEDRSRKNYERSSTNYSYYINTRTGDKASVFSRTKSVYVRLEGCNSEEEQEQREREINKMRVNDPKEECGFRREVLPITQAETEEKDAEKNDKPAVILPIVLTIFLETLKIINDNSLEKYKEKNATGKNGGGLKYVDVIEKINQMLEKSGSIQPYAFVPDPDWLAALKKTKKYKVKGLLGTDLSTLNNNRQGKHKLNT
ncbi:6580_t:CDS:2, partial [Gigaspora rosea]